MVDDQDSIEDNDIDTGPWQQSEQLSPQSCENSTHTSQCNSGSLRRSTRNRQPPDRYSCGDFRRGKM